MGSPKRITKATKRAKSAVPSELPSEKRTRPAGGIYNPRRMATKETRPKSRQRGDQARTIPGASPFILIHTSFGVESTEEGRRSCQSVLDLGVECGLGPPNRRQAEKHHAQPNQGKTMPTQPPDLGV